MCAHACNAHAPHMLFLCKNVRRKFNPVQAIRTPGSEFRCILGNGVRKMSKKSKT